MDMEYYIRREMKAFKKAVSYNELLLIKLSCLIYEKNSRLIYLIKKNHSIANPSCRKVALLYEAYQYAEENMYVTNAELKKMFNLKL
jgi:hypothetical protein